MKKKIAILGSTGSIGKQTLKIIRENRKDFKIVLLSANKNFSYLSKQIKEFDVKNIIISDKKGYDFVRKKFKTINVFNNFNDLKKIFKSKIDYSMCAISGFNGLKPTLDIIQFSKTVAIANKESIICGWNLINNRLKKYKTKFIPVDSEHFSIWSLIKNNKIETIDKIIITASGGPFLNLPKHKFKNINPRKAIKHPTWKMGRKISIDSATMMNKIFELIEARKIFNIEYSKFEIMTHPKSYVHAIVKFKNGLIKILAHDTNMEIPIFNSMYSKSEKEYSSNKINIKILNDLKLDKVSEKKFPSIKILKKLSPNDSLYETVIVSINDELVELFLKNKISFQDISGNLNKFLNMSVFTKYKRQKAKNLAQIEKINDFVRLKTRALSVLSAPK